MDDLPVWGMVGEMYSKDEKTKTSPHVYTERTILIQYNGDPIIYVDPVSDPCRVTSKLVTP